MGSAYLTRARDSQQIEFEHFYDENFKAISNYVGRRLPLDSHDDLVAAIFTVAWRKFDKVREPSLRWLYRIASFEVAHERRRLARQSLVRLQVEDVGSLDQARGEFDVAAALDTLSESDAELIRLLHWENLDRLETAALLNCSVGTLNVRYHRAMERLAGALRRQSSMSQIPLNLPRKEK